MQWKIMQAMKERSTREQDRRKEMEETGKTTSRKNQNIEL
jgi:hypothetical protein